MTNYTSMKLHVHNYTIVIYIQYKVNEIQFIAYKVMAEDGKKSLKFMQSKGDNYSITDDNLMKLPMYNHDIAMYTQYKFHDISSTIGYLVMAEEGQKH